MTDKQRLGREQDAAVSPPIPSHQAGAQHPAAQGQGGCREVSQQACMHRVVQVQVLPGFQEHVLSLCKPSCSSYATFTDLHVCVAQTVVLSS